MHPLRDEDGEFNRRYLNRLDAITRNQHDKRGITQQRYRQRRQRCLERDHNRRVGDTAAVVSQNADRDFWEN